MNLKINKTLTEERSRCTFDVQELIHLIDGGEENTLTRKRIEEIFIREKSLWDDVPEEYLSHKEKYENGIRKACIVVNVFLKNIDRILFENNNFRAPTNAYRIQDGIFRSINPFLVHIALFLNTLSTQTSPEQKAQWLKPNSRMIGAYAQTELGHGSYIKGLETTATFDVETDEFIIHSPTLTSWKWWPGGLGHTANTCVVMAQLLINGKNHGIHLFLAQIRDYDTHEPLPGLKVGEIGPKMGLSTVDNGFIAFDNFRIPRMNMLMKNVQVLRDGTYIRTQNEKLTYAPMVLTRVTLLSDLAYDLSRAAVIGVRYSAVRVQSRIKTERPETQILDYVTQQDKLFILIATSHAFRTVGLWMWNIHKKNTDDVHQGNMDQLQELHALSCCLKSVCSHDISAAVERSRRACGGHGYLLSSNLPQIYSAVTAAITYDGEYTVLMLQTARYLVKAWKAALEGKSLPSSVCFLVEDDKKRYRKWENSPEGIVEGFKALTAGKIKAAYNALQGHISKGRDPEESWNLVSCQLVNASEAYARSLICDVFWTEIKRLSTSVSQNLALVLEQLGELYLVYWALVKCGDLLLYSTIAKDDVDILQSRYEDLLALIRPNAVGLVDAFDIRDEILGSTLGAYDGRVYERILEEALKSPLNAETVNQSFHKYLKPMILKNKL